MTNTKFRKRALLSSVAMLLVALVALGSATFAWFVANPTATASGVKLTTSAAPGVTVASASVLGLAQSGDDVVTAYKASTVLAATGTFAAPVTNPNPAKDLQPVSPNTNPASNSLAFGKIKAANAADEDLDSTAPWEAAVAADYFEEIVYIKASSQDDGVTGPTVKQATVTINLTEAAGNVKTGVKVALVSSTNELIGIWKAAGGQDELTWNGTTGASGALTASAYSCTTSGTAKAIQTAIASSSAINNDGTTGNYIKVYIYLDGEDQNVFSNNVPRLVNIVDSVDVSISTVALS